jgi:hypothetical protein
MDDSVRSEVESYFLSLPIEERTAIITHGAAIRLSELRKRLFLAEGKVRYLAEKYQTVLPQLDAAGLPDDANFEMHEDYIMWHHWVEVANQARKDIAVLQLIAREGLYLSEPPHAGD